MDLLDSIRKDVLRQKEEEALNFFTSISAFRDFISTTNPTPDVSVTVKMTCLGFERLNGDHGTRVTVIDANQRVFFEETAEALGELTSVKRKPYIAQITVWDAKGKPTNGFGEKPQMMFRRGAVYEFRQVDGVGFFSDIAKGSVQFERGSPDKIVEVSEPICKRKAPQEATAKNAKAKKQSPDLGSKSDGDEDDVVMEVLGKTHGSTAGMRTRSAIPTPP